MRFIWSFVSYNSENKWFIYNSIINRIIFVIYPYKHRPTDLLWYFQQGDDAAVYLWKFATDYLQRD